MKRFTKVNIEISNICNLQCSFCPEVIRAKKIMDLPLFTRIIDQVGPLTEQVCFHLMGDPLVHPKLSELVEICQERGVKIYLVTNGVLLREKQAKLLLHPAFRQINFSLHSFADNFGTADPSAYLARIFDFTEAAFQERPDLYINYRLWNLADPHGATPPNLDIIARIEDRFKIRMDRKIDIRLQKSKSIKNRLYLHLDSEFIWPSLDLPQLGTAGRCHGLSNHFGILVDGTVVPCCLDKEGAIPLGKIQDAEIVDILGAPRAQAILKGFQRRKLVEDLCQRCQYIERYQPVKPVISI